MGLICDITNHTTIIKIDDRFVRILYGLKVSETLEEIAKFTVEEVWDTLKDKLTATSPTPFTNPGLHRRHGEALAAKLYTAKLYR